MRRNRILIAGMIMLIVAGLALVRNAGGHDGLWTAGIVVAVCGMIGVAATIIRGPRP